MTTKLLSPSQAAAYICEKTGRPKMSPAVIVRWMSRGIRGRQLSGSLVGGRWFTSEPAIDDLLEQLNADVNHMPAANVAPRAKRVKAAVAELGSMTAANDTGTGRRDRRLSAR